jgi:hypothetical protein
LRQLEDKHLVDLQKKVAAREAQKVMLSVELVKREAEVKVT